MKTHDIYILLICILLVVCLLSCNSLHSNPIIEPDEKDQEKNAIKLIEKYNKLTNPDRNEVLHLIKLLDSEDYHTRKKAEAELIDVGEPALAILKEILPDIQSPEVQQSIGKIIERINETYYNNRRIKLWEIVKGLEKTEGVKAAELLVKLIDHPDRAICMHAAKGLRNFKELEVVQKKSESLLEESRAITDINKYPRKAYLARLAYLIIGGNDEEKYFKELKPYLQVWPSYGHDPQNTRQSPFTGPQKPKLKWVFSEKIEDSSMSPAVVGYDGTIYTGSDSEENNFYALNQDGSVKWKFKNSNGVYGSPAITEDGMILFPSGKMHALSPEGLPIWKSEHSGVIQTTENTIYVCDIKLMALNMSGEKKWEFGPRNESCRIAIGEDSMIYLITDNPNDYNNPSYGETALYKIKNDGVQDWKKCDLYSHEPPAIGRGEIVYVNSGGWELNAFKTTSAKIWSLELSKSRNVMLSNEGSAIGPDGTIYACSEDSKLRAISPEGAVKWEFDVGDFLSAPAIDGKGIIYIGTHLGKVFAINPDGTKKWEFKPDKFQKPPPDWGDSYPFRNPVIGLNNTLYVTCDDGGLYAIGDEEFEKKMTEESGK